MNSTVDFSIDGYQDFGGISGVGFDAGDMLGGLDFLSDDWGLASGIGDTWADISFDVSNEVLDYGSSGTLTEFYTADVGVDFHDFGGGLYSNVMVAGPATGGVVAGSAGAGTLPGIPGDPTGGILDGLLDGVIQWGGRMAGMGGRLCLG